MATIKYNQGIVTDEFFVILKDYETINITAMIGREQVNIKIRFLPSVNSENPELSLTWETKEDSLCFTFHCWNNQLSSTTKEVTTEIGSTNQNEPINMRLVHCLAGDMHELKMQFVLGYPKREEK